MQGTKMKLVVCACVRVAGRHFLSCTAVVSGASCAAWRDEEKGGED